MLAVETVTSGDAARTAAATMNPSSDAPAAQAPARKPPAVLAKDGTDITELVALIRDGNDAQKQYAAGALQSLAVNADNKIAIAQAKREAGI